MTSPKIYENNAMEEEVAWTPCMTRKPSLYEFEEALSHYNITNAFGRSGIKVLSGLDGIAFLGNDEDESEEFKTMQVKDIYPQPDLYNMSKLFPEENQKLTSDHQGQKFTRKSSLDLKNVDFVINSLYSKMKTITTEKLLSHNINYLKKKISSFSNVEFVPLMMKRTELLVLDLAQNILELNYPTPQNWLNHENFLEKIGNFSIKMLELAMATLLETNLNPKKISKQNGKESDDTSGKEQKNLKRMWTEEELAELQLITDDTQGILTSNAVEEFTSKYGRSENSIRNKFHTLKQDLKCQKLEESSNSISSEFGRLCKIEDMIIDVLHDFPGCAATTEEILAKIESVYHISANSKNLSSTQRSISQTLSSSNKFLKIKGMFKLSSLRDVFTNKNEACTVKRKIQYLLSKEKDYQASLQRLKDAYVEEFKSDVNDDAQKLKKLSATINKTLIQNKEFDKTQSKTKYALRSQILFQCILQSLGEIKKKHSINECINS